VSHLAGNKEKMFVRMRESKGEGGGRERGRGKWERAREREAGEGERVEESTCTRKRGICQVLASERMRTSMSFLAANREKVRVRVRESKRERGERE